MSAKQDPRNNPQIITGATRSLLTIAPLASSTQVRITSYAEAWHILAGTVLERYAATGQRFTRDTLMAHGVEEPDEPHHWTRLFSRYAAAGIIRKVGDRAAPRPGQRSRRSNVWQGTPAARGTIDDGRAAA